MTAAKTNALCRRLNYRELLLELPYVGVGYWTPIQWSLQSNSDPKNPCRSTKPSANLGDHNSIGLQEILFPLPTDQKHLVVPPSINDINLGAKSGIVLHSFSMPDLHGCLRTSAGLLSSKKNR